MSLRSAWPPHAANSIALQAICRMPAVRRMVGRRPESQAVELMSASGVIDSGCVGHLLGGPGREQVQCMRGRRGGFGDVERQRQPRIGDHVDALVEQFKVADDVMVERLGPGAVGADVVGTPAATEIVTAGG